MATIWKWDLIMTDKQEIETPENWEPLSVGNQGGALCLWAAVSSEYGQKVRRQIAIVGTGNPLWCADWKFIGTAVFPGLVWHVYVK